MRESHKQLSPFRPWALVLVAVASTVACGGGAKEPKTLPAQTVSQVAPELEPPPAPPLPPPVRELPPPPRPLVTVIDSGEGDEVQPKTLLEASRLAKARKSDTPPSVVEINDENLHEYAEGAKVIIMESTIPPGAINAPAGGPDADDALDPDREVSRDELYWRDRGLELRRGWRRALDDIDRLELEAAALRQRFYAEDDPYVRDAQIKPAWDRALDRLSELREEDLRYRAALADYLEEGRQSDVPPGWLSEGWELEPTAEELREKDAIPIQEPIDTPVMKDPSRNVSSEGGAR